MTKEINAVATKVTNKFIVSSSPAGVNPWTSDVYNKTQLNTDVAAIPKSWDDIIQLCYFFYERDSLIRTVIDKQVEIAINDLTVVATDGLDSDESNLYRKIVPDLLDFISTAATEYYLSGLVIPDIVWGDFTAEESGLEKDYIVPQDIWIRDPLQIELKKTPLTNRVVPIWKVPGEDIEFITSGGKYSDGTVDEETYKLLEENFKEFVSKVKSGENKFPLLDHYVIRRKPLIRSVYPIPYLMPAMEMLLHKRNIRAMDYALIGRVIDGILHFKIGSDEFPLTEDDDDMLTEIEAQIRQSGSQYDKKRVVELFTSHVVDIKWIIPPLDALLDINKYDEVNQEILYALGFPKFLVTGEKDKSNTGSSGSALLSPLNSMKTLRRDFEKLINRIFKEIAERNGFSSYPKASFAPLNLVELSDLLQIAQLLEQRDIISRTSMAKLAGFDFISEYTLRQKENELPGIKENIEQERQMRTQNEEDNTEQQD